MPGIMSACRYRTRSGKIAGVVPMLGVLVLFKRFVRMLRKDRLDRVLLALVVIVLAGMLGMAYLIRYPWPTHCGGRL